MDTQGRAQAVTVISPVRPWWALWLRVSFPLLSRAPQPPLLRLAFIHFAHWSLLRKIPPRGPGRSRPLPRPYLIFNSNFNGDITAYIDAFALVVPWRMRLIWHGIYGFPGPKVVDRFLSFVVAHASPVQHYYSAYPEGSAKMIAQALELKDHHDLLVQRTSRVEDERFASDWGRFVHENQGLLYGGAICGPRQGPVPTSLVVLAPLTPGAAEHLGPVLEALPEGSQSPFAEVPGTHFARFVLVDALTGPNDEPLESEGAFLLLAADFDGSADDWTAALCKNAGGTLGPIMGGWEDFPSVNEPAEVASFFDRYNAPPGLTFPGYQATVGDAQGALRLAGALRALAVRAQNEGLEPGPLRQAWREVLGNAA
jgi:hypothetical protein